MHEVDWIQVLIYVDDDGTWMQGQHTYYLSQLAYSTSTVFISWIDLCLRKKIINDAFIIVKLINIITKNCHIQWETKNCVP